MNDQFLMAVQKSKYTLVKDLRSYIKKNNVDIFEVDRQSSWNYLHNAAYHDNVEAIELLIELGLDINSLTGIGYTSLYLAFYRSNINAFKSLVELGADINKLANRKSQDGTIDFLKKFIRNYRANLDMLELLVEKVSNPRLLDLQEEFAILMISRPREATRINRLLNIINGTKYGKGRR